MTSFWLFYEGKRSFFYFEMLNCQHLSGLMLPVSHSWFPFGLNLVQVIPYSPCIAIFQYRLFCWQNGKVLNGLMSPCSVCVDDDAVLLFRVFCVSSGGKVFACVADDGVTCLLPLCLLADGVSFVRNVISVDVVELLT